MEHKSAAGFTFTFAAMIRNTFTTFTNWVIRKRGQKKQMPFEWPFISKRPKIVGEEQNSIFLAFEAPKVCRLLLLLLQLQCVFIVADLYLQFELLLQSQQIREKR